MPGLTYTLKADATGVEKGIQTAEQAVKRFKKEAEKPAGGMFGGKSGAGVRGAGGVSLQIQDVAVQIQQGTKASTILMQQGTQLLSVFGPGGMIAGGLLGIGVLAYNAFQQYGESVKGAVIATNELGVSLEKAIASGSQSSLLSNIEAVSKATTELNKAMKISGEAGFIEKASGILGKVPVLGKIFEVIDESFSVERQNALTKLGEQQAKNQAISREAAERIVSLGVMEKQIADYLAKGQEEKVDLLKLELELKRKIFEIENSDFGRLFPEESAKRVKQLNELNEIEKAAIKKSYADKQEKEDDERRENSKRKDLKAQKEIEDEKQRLRDKAKRDKEREEENNQDRIRRANERAEEIKQSEKPIGEQIKDEVDSIEKLKEEIAKAKFLNIGASDKEAELAERNLNLTELRKRAEQELSATKREAANEAANEDERHLERLESSKEKQLEYIEKQMTLEQRMAVAKERVRNAQEKAQAFRNVNVRNVKAEANLAEAQGGLMDVREEQIQRIMGGSTSAAAAQRAERREQRARARAVRILNKRQDIRDMDANARGEWAKPAEMNLQGGPEKDPVEAAVKEGNTMLGKVEQQLKDLNQRLTVA